MDVRNAEGPLRFGLSMKAVSSAPNGMDQRLLERLVDLVAQTADMRLDDIRIRIKVGIHPDVP